MLEEFVTLEANRKRYMASPVGPYVDGYLMSLRALGVGPVHLRTHAQRVAVFGEFLADTAIAIEALDDQHVDAFAGWYRANPRRRGMRRRTTSASIDETCRACARRFLAYLRSIDVAGPAPRPAALHPDCVEYLRFLDRHRGFARRTIEIHAGQVALLLGALHAAGTAIGDVTVSDVERAVVNVSATLGVRSHQIFVSAVEAFLRFGRSTGRIPTACVPFLPRRRRHALAALPAALSEADVERVLAAPNDGSAMARRDHAILQLLATYGLRAGEVANLRLDDIRWRSGTLRIQQSKVRRELALPLVEPVATAIVAYLRDGRPPTDARQVFLKCVAPAGPLTRTVVYEVVRKSLVAAGIDSQHWGPHMFRHARATSLVRRGVPLKTIGDLLGHRVPEATSIYCKLATEDLRAVALEIPEAAR